MGSQTESLKMKIYSKVTDFTIWEDQPSRVDRCAAPPNHRGCIHS